MRFLRGLCPPLLRAARTRVPSALSRHTVIKRRPCPPPLRALEMRPCPPQLRALSDRVFTAGCIPGTDGFFVYIQGVSYERATGCSLLGAYRAPTRLFVYIQGGLCGERVATGFSLQGA